MKKQIFLGAALLLLTASCSNNDTTSEDEKGKVNVAQAVDFAVDFADYNAEQEVGVTRAGEANKEEKLEQQAVDLGNGVLAMCTLQRDTTQQTKQERQAATRALADDTYTMLAYDAATHAFKGEMTGTVSGGAFTPADAQKRILLEPGTYDFVLFNSKVSRSGNNLTVNRSDAANAMIGRTQQTINPTPKQQQVAFTLKHAGAKVKIQVIGYMDFSGVTATLESVNATDIPGSSVYDATTGTWTVGTGTAISANTTYGAAQQLLIGGDNQFLYAANSNEEIAFMPATDISKLKLSFTAGSIYKINMANKGLIFNPTSLLKLEQNGAYVLNVNLVYNFLYLMSDGTTDFVNSTQYTRLRQSDGITKRYVDKSGHILTTPKIPIAIVVSQSRRMAVALKKANNGARTYWCTGSNNIYTPVNTHNVSNLVDAFANPTSGYEETWNAAYSIGSVGVKATNPDFHAFRAAATYNPGAAITGSNISRWFLPSFSEFKLLFSALGFGDNTAVTQIFTNYSWYYRLFDFAYTQVGADRISYFTFWTSSENDTHAGTVTLTQVGAQWGRYFKDSDYFVLPFVKY